MTCSQRHSLASNCASRKPIYEPNWPCSQYFVERQMKPFGSDLCFTHSGFRAKVIAEAFRNLCVGKGSALGKDQLNVQRLSTKRTRMAEPEPASVFWFEDIKIFNLSVMNI